MNSSGTNDTEQALILKGATYDLSPLNIIVALHVIIHNTIIFLDYFKDRTKLVPALFMGIALADLLTAQGLLVISVISVLVYSGGVVEENILYKSIYYYMSTALPGFSASRYLNLVMSVTLTVHVVDPFRRLNTSFLKRFSLAIIVLVTFLHILDTVLFIIIDWRYNITATDSLAYFHLCEEFEFPGVITTILVPCIKQQMDTAQCVYEKHEHLHQFPFSDPLLMIPIVIFGVLPFITLFCMIIQLVYLQRGSALLPQERKHASNTIMMNSILFFICHTTYLTAVSVWKLILRYHFPSTVALIKWSLLLGFMEFTLPLLYAAVFPVILIWRKEELRRRYVGRVGRILSCWRREDNVTDED